MQNSELKVREMFADDVCNEACDSPERRIARAKELAFSYAQIDGGHHKLWVIDQMIHALCGTPLLTKTATDYHGNEYAYQDHAECGSTEYEEFVNEYQGPPIHDDDYDEPSFDYTWDTGCPP